MAWAIALEGADEVKACVRIAQGGNRHVEVSVPAFLSAILLAHCEWAILVHNHPSGSLTISNSDKALTQQIIEATALCGITLVDHYIISPDGRDVSLVAAGVMTPAPVAQPTAAS
jgi:DNA repair protein RadC